MTYSRRGSHYGDRIKKTGRDTMASDFVRDAGERIQSFLTGKAVLSRCFGLAAGFALGMLFRRRE